MTSVALALQKLVDQLPADQGPAERVTIVQANERHYVARIEYGDEDDFEAYQLVLEDPPDSDA